MRRGGEMVDTLDSGSSDRKIVEVRVLSPAPCRTSSSVERCPEEAGVPSSTLGFGTTIKNIVLLGRLAQLVERFVYTEDVRGPSPLPPTTKK